MTENSVNPPRRSPLWMRILLGVSLALNLAVVGLAVGASLRLIGPGGPPPHSFGGALIRAMPAEDRKAIGRQARAHIGRSGHKADSAQLIAALRATPYDQSVVVELLEAQAAGRPVIAFGRGGATETVRPLDGAECDAATGLWFDAQEPDSLAAAVRRFIEEEHRFDPARIRRHAERFSAERFRTEMRGAVESCLAAGAAQ